MSSEQASRPGSGPGGETKCSLVTSLLTQPSGCSDCEFVGRFSEGLPVRVSSYGHGQHGPLCHRHVPSLPRSLLSRVLFALLLFCCGSSTVVRQGVPSGWGSG